MRSLLSPNLAADRTRWLAFAAENGWRLRVLLALFLLLTLTTSAYPECAWVLWKHDAFAGSAGQKLLLEPTPLGGHDTKTECEDMRKEEQAAHVRQGWTKQSISTVSKPHGQFLHFICLPDTVDPRGPKGQ